MEAMMTQAMAPASFFYYSPDPNPDNRQHGHFTCHPGMAVPQPMPMYPVVPTLPSTPIYSRPSSSCSQPPMQPMQHPNAFTSVPSNMTPMASPRLMVCKPQIVLETEIHEDGQSYPSTPPLSSSGSVISSPGSCDMLQTPLNPMFSGLDGVEGKEACDVDGQLEIFPNLDWANCTSPPMTPVYLQSQAQPPKIIPSDLLSTTSCAPSLSPSPPPYAKSISSDDIDFCDPRNLTVGTVNSTLAPEYSALPTLCAGDDEEHKFVLRGEAFVKTAVPAISANSSFEFNPQLQLPTGLPSFDDFSDLESEDDFVNGLVNLGEPAVATQTNRSRASSDAVSLGHSSYACEDELEDFLPEGLPSPPESCGGNDAHAIKRQKTSKDTSKPIMNTAATDSQSGSTEQQQTSSTKQESGNDSNDENKNTPDDSGAENNAPASLPAPQNRRGRKQSLTEDPTKTFVCDLCNRRFRRQEHLKRHYRSLHTQEKPFECHECGKKFSRSDNLSQHARTHGSGAIVMNLIDDPMDLLAATNPGAFPHPGLALPPVGGEDYHTLGKVLFQVAAEVPGSASELSSDEGSDYGKKKRKRAE